MGTSGNRTVRPVLALLAIVVAMLALAAPAHAAFPGANGKIAFSLYPHIYTMNPDGTGVTALTRDASVWDREPAWSPDGTKIAFSRAFFAPCYCDEIFTVNADGSDLRQLTHDGRSNTTPAWSPDGTKIAFANQPDSNGPDVWVMNADGSSPVDIANAGWDPAWSPDGTKIAYTRQLGGIEGLDVALMNPDGTGKVSVTGRAWADEAGPNWSPDGRKLVFWFDPAEQDAGASGKYDIGAINPDGTNLVDLTPTPTPDEYDPVWSPDGHRIAFERDPSIVVADPDGTNQAEIDLHQASAPHDPDWQPLPTFRYQYPRSASQLNVSLVPAFRQCGTGGNPSNAKHAPPLATNSCNLPQPGSVVARVGLASQSSAQFSVTPGDSDPTNGNQADVAITASLTDIQSTAGGDYNPNASGADLTAVTRLRFTDKANGYGGLPATATEYDFKVPIDCSATPDPITGSICTANTTANALAPGLIQEQQQAVVQAFRVRIDDAGANGIRGDSDDRIFMTQGVFVP